MQQRSANQQYRRTRVAVNHQQHGCNDACTQITFDSWASFEQPTRKRRWSADDLFTQLKPSPAFNSRRTASTTHSNPCIVGIAMLHLDCTLSVFTFVRVEPSQKSPRSCRIPAQITWHKNNDKRLPVSLLGGFPAAGVSTSTTAARTSVSISTR